jgi:hypothetical protein
MPDYKAVPAGELQVTAQLPFWGDVSHLIPMRSMVGLHDAGSDEDGRGNEGPESRSPMSENPDMGHPIILG